MKNKKGAVVTGLTTIFLYFGFILLLILFFFIFKATKENVEVKISGNIEDVDINYEALNYLRMPVKFDFDGKEINTDILDLIIRYFLAEDTKDRKKNRDLLKKETEEIFNEKYPHLEWKLKISDKESFDKGFEFAEELIKGVTTSKPTKEETLVKGMAVVCIIMPNPESKKPIKVEFDFLDSNANAFARSKYYRLKKSEFNC